MLENNSLFDQNPALNPNLDAFAIGSSDLAGESDRYLDADRFQRRDPSGWYEPDIPGESLSEIAAFIAENTTGIQKAIAVGHFKPDEAIDERFPHPEAHDCADAPDFLTNYPDFVASESAPLPDHPFHSIQQQSVAPSSAAKIASEPAIAIGLTVPIAPTGTVSGQVNASDIQDFYNFTLDRPGIFTAELVNLTGDADLRLIRDVNNNGAIDPVSDRNANGFIDREEIETLAWQPNRGTASEAIRQFLDPGSYTIQAIGFNQQTVNYALNTNFTAADADPQAFTISLNFGAGTENLSETHRNTIRQAANRLEQLISHSPFNTPQTLAIDVSAENLGDSFLAFAGPTMVRRVNDLRMPVQGVATINSNPNSDLMTHPRYLYDTMIHEFAHVLGIGTLWQERNLVANSRDGLYDGNTFAGTVYGEMLGTFAPTPVDLTVNVGEGSDLGHWRKNPTFDNEILVESGSAQEQQVTSQLTIAALRDLGWNVNYGAAEPYQLPQFRSVG